MATHSSILAWENSMDRGAWLPSMGSQSWTQLKQLTMHVQAHARARTRTHTHTHTHTHT